MDNQFPLFQVASQKLFDRSRLAIPASKEEMRSWLPATAKSLIKSEWRLFAVDQGDSGDIDDTSHLPIPPSNNETYIIPSYSKTFHGVPAGQLLVELACSRVQPVPAVFSVNTPDSLNANKSPFVAMCAWLQAPPEGSAGKSGFRLVSVRLIECMTPFAVVINIRLFESSISKSVM